MDMNAHTHAIVRTPPVAGKAAMARVVNRFNKQRLAGEEIAALITTAATE